MCSIGAINLTSVTFGNTTGWYVTEMENETSGTTMDVPDAATNARNLVSNYFGYYWYRK